MHADDWEDLKEDICTQLLIGKENGEPELDTMARLVWLEREKCLTLVISGDLRRAVIAALEDVEKTAIDQGSGVGLPKGKVLEWKTRSISTGVSTPAAGSREPA